MRRMLWARILARKLLGERFTDWYRRRRATRRHLKAISYELLSREMRLEAIEGGIAAERNDFYESRVADVMERTEILVQELDRRIEGLSARTGQRLSGLEGHIAELRDELDALRLSVEAARSVATPQARTESRERSAEGTPSAVGE
jgi:hypothetical protein